MFFIICTLTWSIEPIYIFLKHVYFRNAIRIMSVLIFVAHNFFDIFHFIWGTANVFIRGRGLHFISLYEYFIYSTIILCRIYVSRATFQVLCQPVPIHPLVVLLVLIAMIPLIFLLVDKFTGMLIVLSLLQLEVIIGLTRGISIQMSCRYVHTN